MIAFVWFRAGYVIPEVIERLSPEVKHSRPFAPCDRIGVPPYLVAIIDRRSEQRQRATANGFCTCDDVVRVVRTGEPEPVGRLIERRAINPRRIEDYLPVRQAGRTTRTAEHEPAFVHHALHTRPRPMAEFGRVCFGKTARQRHE